jgi:TolB-like protein/DNA-binding winged helix-turn-helix (wHTH) protein
MLSVASTTPVHDVESSSLPSIYRFGVIEVDFHAGELRKAGMRVHLQDQPLQVLSILLRHPGKTVSREEFRKSLWSADTFVDFDHGLNSAVKRLRAALDDDSDHPRFVETIPRHGYRFIAPITETPTSVASDGCTADWSCAVPPSLDSGLAAAAPAENPGVKNVEHGRESPASARRQWLFALSIVGLILVAFVLVLVRAAYVHQRPASPAPHSRVVLAVLPFRDLTVVTSHRFVAEGMTQELLTHLGKLDPTQVVVTARSAPEPSLPGSKYATIRGGEPGAEYVLHGSAQLQGSHLRISVQMMKTGDQTYVWAESYDDTADDLLRAQADIAAQITTAIRQKLTR